MLEILSQNDPYEIHKSNDLVSFVEYLDRPAWFKAKFLPAFEHHFNSHRGELFLAYENNDRTKVVGCIYCDLKPEHVSFGNQIPIFGWFQADSQNIAHDLLIMVELYVKENGYSDLRGPINQPKIFGGWGIMIEGFNNLSLIESAQNSIYMAEWLKTAGYLEDSEYWSIYNSFQYQMEFQVPGIKILDLSIEKILADHALLNQIKEFGRKNFVSFLPDNSTGAHMDELLELLTQVPNGGDYLVIACEEKSNDVIGVFLALPNIFEKWQEKPITSVNVNTAIVDKKYRGNQVALGLYLEMFRRVSKMGVKNVIAGLVWTKNSAAMNAFTKAGDIWAKFIVFQKKLN